MEQQQQNSSHCYVVTREQLDYLVIENLAALTPNSIVGIDFETYVKDEYTNVSSGLDPYCNKLRLLSINWIGSSTTYVIDLHSIDITNLLLLLKNSSHMIWAHNAAFEIRQIKHHYGLELDNIYCSMVMFKTLYAATGWRQGKSIGAGLGAIMRHFAGVELSKDLQTSEWSSNTLSKQQIKYSALDVSTAWLNLIQEVFTVLRDEYDCIDAFNLDQNAMRILAIVEYDGFNIDTNKMNAFIDELEKLSILTKIDLAKQLDQPLSVSLELDDDTGQLIPILSVAPEVTKLFNNPTKLAQYISRKYKVNLPALNAVIMTQFLEQDEEEEEDDIDLGNVTNKEEAKQIVNTLITYKKQEKLLTEIRKYVHIVNPVTKALHATTNAVGAGTGRMSSSSNIIVGSKRYKMNLQQVIARGNYDIRSGYIARPGYLIAGIDFSSQEVLTAMAFANDEAGLAPFYEKKRVPYLLDNNGVVVLDSNNQPLDNPYTDPHLTAAIGLCPALKDYTPDIILKKSKGGHDGIDYRYRGKILNFSVIYGKTEVGLANDLKCSVEEAKEVLDSYFGKYYMLREWLDRTAWQAVKCKRIKLPTNRWLWVEESNSKGLDNAAKRKGPNACVQGFCADQLKYTLPQVKRYLQEINNKYSVANKIVALVHDEIVYELEETMTYEVGEHLRNMMQDIQGEMLYRYFKCETGGFSSLTIANCWKK